MAEVAVRSAGAGDAITMKRSTFGVGVEIVLKRFDIIAEHLEGKVDEHRLGVPLDLVRELEALGARLGNALGVMLADKREHARQILLAL